MFVSESTLNFMGGTKIQIISAEGHVWEGQIDPSATVETLKKLTFQHFYPNDTLSSPDNFRVVFPAECRTLGDNHAIHEERLKENDVLLLIRKRAANPPDEPAMELKAPTAAEILEATKNLPVQPKPTSKNQQSSSNSNRSNPFGGHHQDTATEANVDVRLM